jgi:hypothetical protein
MREKKKLYPLSFHLYPALSKRKKLFDNCIEKHIKFFQTVIRGLAFADA